MKSTWSVSSLVVASALCLPLGFGAGRTMVDAMFGLLPYHIQLGSDLLWDDRILSALEANDFDQAGRLIRNDMRGDLILMKEMRSDKTADLEAQIRRRESILATDSESTSDRMGKCGSKGFTLNEATPGAALAMAQEGTR